MVGPFTAPGQAVPVHCCHSDTLPQEKGLVRVHSSSLGEQPQTQALHQAARAREDGRGRVRAEVWPDPEERRSPEGPSSPPPLSLLQDERALSPRGWGPEGCMLSEGLLCGRCSGALGSSP